jgi:hypothetical protein
MAFMAFRTLTKPLRASTPLLRGWSCGDGCQGSIDAVNQQGLFPECSTKSRRYPRGLGMLGSADHAWKSRLITWPFWEPSLGLWWQ